MACRYYAMIFDTDTYLMTFPIRKMWNMIDMNGISIIPRG